MNVYYEILHMNNHDEIIPKRRRKLKASYVITALLLVIIAGFLLFKFNLRSKLQSRLDAISAAGYPVTCVELDAWHTIPEFSENAADTMIEAFSHYYEWDKQYLDDLPVAGSAELPARTEPVSEEMKAIAAEYLSDNKKALDLLYKGAAIEHSRYPADLTQSFYAPLPPLGDVRQGAKMLKLEAVLHAEKARPQLATDSVTAIFGVARSLDKEPILISQLVRISCEALAVSALERVVNRTELTDEQLVKLSQILENADDSAGISRAFAGERCIVVEFLKDPASYNLTIFSDPPPCSTQLITLCKITGLADTDAMLYIDLMSNYMEVMQLEPHYRKEAAEAAEAKLKKISKIHVLLHIVMPSLFRCVTSDLRGIARLQTARVALAIERYRLATGTLPDTLGELTPTYIAIIPKDPFDGKDLRYQKLDTGFVVYSIGKDGQDDGGKERPSDESCTYDVTFIIER